MDLPDDVRAVLFDAGAAALTHNAPLAATRAERIAAWLAAEDPSTIVDLGCGRGGMVVLLSDRLPAAAIVGVDIDGSAIDVARLDLQQAGRVGGRIRYEVGDAAAWIGPVDAAVCIGASHAFGTPSAMFAGLAAVVPEGVAVVGDGVWHAPPDDWCRDVFGALPSVDELAAEAVEAGWDVIDADLSTLAEWDDFEHRWIEGVRTVGTPEALAFAAGREAEYQRYRGVLGFAWLLLRTSAGRPVPGAPQRT